MIVNWGNVTNAINAGSTALAASNLGTPADTSSVGFYDHAIGDFSEAAENNFIANRDRFIVGAHKWGSLTEVVSK